MARSLHTFDASATTAGTSVMAMAGPARSHALLPLALLMLCTLLLVGCIGGSSTASRFYMIAPEHQSMTAPAEAGASPRARVAVGPVTVASYLDRPQIVTREGNGVRLALAEFDRWAEPLSESLPRVLAEEISRELGGERVQVFPGARGEDADIRISVDVTRLDGDLGGEAVLEAWWTLHDAKGGVLRRGRVTERRAAGNDYHTLVKAESELTVKLAAATAVALRKELP